MNAAVELKVVKGGGHPTQLSNHGSINIDRNLCKQLENAHCEYNSCSQVEKKLLESHKNDVNAKILESAVFKQYHKQTIDAMSKCEEFKNILVSRYDLYEYDWVVDFRNCRVVIS